MPAFHRVLHICVLALPFAAVAQAQVIVAHRGASFDAPENTLSAFHLAWEQNADGIEGDFYFTKDKQLVCIHDADTERTGGKKLIVADSTLAELRTLRYGGWKDARFKGETLPTFADVLATVPAGKQFVIELKTGPEIVPLLKAEIARLKPKLSDLLVISFHKETVLASKRELPEIRAHLLISYKRNEFAGTWSPTRADVAKALDESGADGLGTQGNGAVVTAGFIAYLRERGMREFHVWTIDEPRDARYFRSLGAIGITTNRPGLLREALRE
jgi:glycerophosphoryl diester phosphodiesterase